MNKAALYLIHPSLVLCEKDKCHLGLLGTENKNGKTLYNYYVAMVGILCSKGYYSIGDLGTKKSHQNDQGAGTPSLGEKAREF